MTFFKTLLFIDHLFKNEKYYEPQYSVVGMIGTDLNID